MNRAQIVFLSTGLIVLIFGALQIVWFWALKRRNAPMITHRLPYVILSIAIAVWIDSLIHMYVIVYRSPCILQFYFFCGPLFFYAAFIHRGVDIVLRYIHGHKLLSRMQQADRDLGYTSIMQEGSYLGHSPRYSLQASTLSSSLSPRVPSTSSTKAENSDQPLAPVPWAQSKTLFARIAGSVYDRSHFFETKTWLLYLYGSVGVFSSGYLLVLFLSSKDRNSYADPTKDIACPSAVLWSWLGLASVLIYGIPILFIAPVLSWFDDAYKIKRELKTIIHLVGACYACWTVDKTFFFSNYYNESSVPTDYVPKLQHYNFFLQALFCSVFGCLLTYPCYLCYQDAFFKEQTTAILEKDLPFYSFLCSAFLFQWRFSSPSSTDRKYQRTQRVVLNDIDHEKQHHRIEVANKEYIAEGEEPLPLLLNSERYREGFVEFCCAEFSIENLMFYEACCRLQSMKHDISTLKQIHPETAFMSTKQSRSLYALHQMILSLASFLFQNYIFDNSPQQVNLPSHISQRLHAFFEHQSNRVYFQKYANVEKRPIVPDKPARLTTPSKVSPLPLTISTPRGNFKGMHHAWFEPQLAVEIGADQNPSIDERKAACDYIPRATDGYQSLDSFPYDTLFEYLEQAQKEIYRLMDTDTRRRFLQSNLYKRTRMKIYG